jgi:hypothetical protein
MTKNINKIIEEQRKLWIYVPVKEVELIIRPKKLDEDITNLTNIKNNIK